MFKPLAALLALTALCACATVTEGTKATVAIDTPGADGATCQVANAAGNVTGSVRTPGSVTLAKARTPLTVTCSKPGYRTASAPLAPAMADKAKLQMPTGYVVDAVSGAMWTYPDRITVPMTKG